MLLVKGQMEYLLQQCSLRTGRKDVKMNAQDRFRRAFLLISMIIAALSLTVPSKAGQIKAQARKEIKDKPARPQKTAPTYADVSYGPSNANKLDFWQVKSRRPAPLLVFIHGGGFRGGSKNSIPPELLTKSLEAGIACTSIDYRLSGEAIYPAQMHDSVRAIQFIRSKAVEWNIDLKRVAAGGGSAGSGISQWLGFHDDLASPTSDDPIASQSTRLTAVLALNMQSTYDPRQIKNIVPGNAYNHPALKQLFGLPQNWNWLETQIDGKLDAGLKDVSPITHLTKDDPPVFILHYAAANKDGNIHHPNFGKHLKKAMDALGIECIRKMDTDFKSRSEQYTAQVQFLKRHFGMP
jgi:acetyl esterase/lipase